MAVCKSNGNNILLVDDDLAFLKVAQSILHNKGYLPDVARNAEEALHKAKNKSYNLAVLDMLLPDMNGVDLLSSLREIQPDILTIMLTGFSSVEHTVQSLNRGAFAFLEKPLNPDRLLEVIQRGIEKQQLVVENRHLMKELEHRNRDLNILLSITQAVSYTLKPEDIVKPVLETIAGSLGLDGHYLLVFDDNFKTLNGYWGFTEKLKNKIQSLELNTSCINRVIKNSEPLIVNSIRGDTDPLLSLLAQENYKSFIAVPVVATNETKGLLGIAINSEHVFSPLEVNLLKAIGREVSVAIMNAQLFEEASKVKALKELDTMRTELLANVSHELRTPLAAIKGFASSLLQPDVTFDEETRKSFILTIDSEADRLSHLIDDLLLMSRIEAGVYKAKKEWYDISQILGSIKDRLYNIALKNNLRIEIQKDLPPVMVEGSRIGEVITNLVENAVKYSNEGGEIRIEVTLQNGEIITRVIDNGLGIPKEYQPMVFDRFNQVSRKNGQRKGSGLGLCICKGIVESHGGKIWVESEPGKGATFSFSIPVTKES
jgi:K+-sensing histidine kinase KdpD